MKSGPGAWLALAFVEGVACLVLEIAGARALAPYFGTSHVVWTAQITATLSCLALGYAMGARLAFARNYARLGQLLVGSALWLAASGFVRAPLFHFSSSLGIGFGSFFAACVSFGPPLFALGALGPVMIERFGKKRAGSIAGSVLFFSTVGGLGGGWFAALFALSQLGVRLTLSLTAVVVALIAVGWTRAHGGQWRTRFWLAPVATAILAWATPAPALEIGPAGARGRIISSVQGATGLVQVLDVPAVEGRFLVIDGTVQGAARRSTGKSLVEFSEYLEVGARWCRPASKRVLVVGLGAGTLARSLALSGVETVAVEIDPAVVAAARAHFDLPASVEVAVRDARELIRSDRRLYDAILLDVYRGESFPWHLGTREAFEAMRERLEPGGCVAVNGIVKKTGDSPGFARLEAVAATTFAQAGVFHGGGDAELVNATLVASDALPPLGTAAKATGRAHFATFRIARPNGPIATDDRSDFDQADSELRLAWRKSLLGELDPASLVD